MLEMLEHLRIYPGRGSLEELRHNCGIYMEAVGLRGDVAAASLGSNEIRQLIISGCSALEAEEMRQLVDRLGLRAASPRATLLIQAIDRYPWLETAVASVDWVDDFRGSEPRERRWRSTRHSGMRSSNRNSRGRLPRSAGRASPTSASRARFVSQPGSPPARRFHARPVSPSPFVTGQAPPNRMSSL